MSNVDVANPLLLRRPLTIWCIQQFDSQLSDADVHLLSRPPTGLPGGTKRKVCPVAEVQ